jgi:hypothetical protein
MSRIMATDADGDSYVAERSVGDATVTVLTGTIRKERRDDGTAYWATATYTVTGPDGQAGEDIIRLASGLYDVPAKGASRVGLTQAVAIALGREAPPAPAPGRRRTVAGPDGDLEAVLAASLANAKPGPKVHAEPRENWELKQGDRIMRHLALYPEGVDPATMSAGMHDMPTAKIRAHLRRLLKDDGPVVELEPGKYARRGAT